MARRPFYSDKEPFRLRAEFLEQVWENGRVDHVFKHFSGDITGLGSSEPLDALGYLGFYLALAPLLRNIKVEILDWRTLGGKHYFDQVIRGRGGRQDSVFNWYSSARLKYVEGKVQESHTFVDFYDLFRQIGIVDEEALELGLLGEEALRLELLDSRVRQSVTRIFWPQKFYGQPESQYLPSPKQIEVAFKSVTFGLLTTDLRGRILKVNRSLEKLLQREWLELEGRTFQDLLVGDGKVAESMSAKAVLEKAHSSYRLPLLLDGKEGPVSTWVSAVLVERLEGESILLRSIERVDFLEELVALQERERQLLLGELEGELLEPVLGLWKEIQPSSRLEPTLGAHCWNLCHAILTSLRAKILELRNPILEGAALVEVCPGCKMDEAVSKITDLTALLSYKLISESVERLGATPDSVEVCVDEEWLLGTVGLTEKPGDSQLAQWKRLARLVGGRVSVRDEEATLSLRFEFPNAFGEH